MLTDSDQGADRAEKGFERNEVLLRRRSLMTVSPKKNKKK